MLGWTLGGALPSLAGGLALATSGWRAQAHKQLFVSLTPPKPRLQAATDKILLPKSFKGGFPGLFGSCSLESSSNPVGSEHTFLLEPVGIPIPFWTTTWLLHAVNEHSG